MTVNPRHFRRTIGLFATGVTIVATESEGEIHAMTANAVTSLSLDPALVIVCIGKQARLIDFLASASGFSISILREDQRSLSNYFANMWEESAPPPFRFVPWEGGPRLEGCLAAVGCERHQVLDGGDHWIVVGRLLALHQGVPPLNPLLFYGGRYGRLTQDDKAPVPDWDLVEEPVQVFYDPWKA